MPQLQSLVSTVSPRRIRRGLRSAHRHFVFWRAMQRFLKDPEACAQPANPVLRDLIYGWGNAKWIALDAYLAACIQHALETQGPILECGSGLSTLLVGVIAQQRGQSHWVLEHTPTWAALVQRYLHTYALDCVVVCVSPLKDYGAYCWYEPPVASMPARFALVVCDGPPGDTKGGRYGLAPVMRERLQAGCTILLDDAHRQQEYAIAERWAAELGASFTLHGAPKTYVEMVVRG
ncbi:MAG: hypothetical protein AB7N91_22855 [Candidatus Tectimicrobiota bacterium]